jgi:aminoglycoside phosphotransferase (APT) family kinase protein
MDVELDIERPGALVASLRESGRIGAAERVRVEVLAGGVSNRTVLVERESGEAWVVKQPLAKLRVAVDWFSDPRRIGREALGLKYLAEMAPAGAITPLVFEDPAHHLLAMEAVPRPHENWKRMLLGGRVEMRQVEAFGKLLGTIHRAGTERRVEMAQVFGDRSFFESLRVEPYYLYTAERVPEAKGFLKELVFETRLRQQTVVHGDYSPKNVLVVGSGQWAVGSEDKGSSLVLLDHEVIHFGDPAFDLGFSLTHFLAKGHHLPAHRARFAEAARAYWKSYMAALGGVRWRGDVEEFAVRHTLGCLLARVEGRSPLEYLTAGERAWQGAAVLSMIEDVPSRVDELVEIFLDRE